MKDKRYVLNFLGCLVLPGILFFSILSLYIFVAAIKSSYGYWPTYGHPDPSRSGFLIFDIITTTLFLLSLSSPIVYIVSSVFFYNELKKNINCLLFFISIYALWFIWFMFDPGKYINWLLD